MLKLSHIDIFNNAKIWLKNLNHIQELSKIFNVSPRVFLPEKNQKW